jgi:hypothetical protein
MSLPETEIKSGKSRSVKLYTDYVVKFPLNTDLEESLLTESLILGINGTFENIKEIFFWEIIKKYPLLKDSFAEIYEYDLNNTTIRFEKLTLVDDKYFYENFFNIYNKFYFSKYFLDPYLDNHTIDSHTNYGIDNDGNLKLLDYAFVTGHIFDLYDIDFDDINTAKDLLDLEDKMIDDILNDNISLNKDLYFRLLAFVITLKYHNNMPLFYYYSYKYKLLSFREICRSIWSR